MRSSRDTMLRVLRTTPLILVTLFACKKGDKVPSYVMIPAVSVTTSTDQGSSTSRITDVWVYADEESMGVWELPARVPVLREGNSTITITPGIKRNGYYDDRIRYPFYTSWTGSVNVVPTEGVTISPVVTYIDQTSFWIEAFSDPGIQLNLTPASDTSLIIYDAATNADISVDGTNFAGIMLDDDHRYIRVYTDVGFNVFGGPVFLEMDYRNDVTFTVGIQYVENGLASSAPYLYVVPTMQADGNMPWNKIHVDLSPVFNVGGISQRNFYLEVSLPVSRMEGQVYFDNIKLLRTNP